MCDNSPNSDFQSLERKIKLLLNEFKSLKEEVSILKNEREELKSLIEAKDEQIDNFHNKIKISKIVEYMGEGKGDTMELKDKINEYIKEIDRCILHLSQ